MGMVLSPLAPWSCSTAMSSVGSVPTTLAVYLWPVETTVTVMEVAPSMTWLLVRISPVEVRIMPVPAPAPFWKPKRVLMSTTPGVTLAATAAPWDDVMGPEPVAGAEPEPPDDGSVGVGEAEPPFPGTNGVSGASEEFSAWAGRCRRLPIPRPITADTITATRINAMPDRPVLSGGGGGWRHSDGYGPNGGGGGDPPDPAGT